MNLINYQEGNTRMNLTKKEADKLGKLANIYIEAKSSTDSDVSDAIGEIDKVIRETRDRIATILGQQINLGPLIDAKDALADYLDELADRYEAEWAEKSEKWQESDAGQSAQVWTEKMREYAEELHGDLSIVEEGSYCDGLNMAEGEADGELIEGADYAIDEDDLLGLAEGRK